MKQLYFFLLILIFFTLPGFAADLGGLQISASVDVVGEAGLNKDGGAADNLNVRGAEVLLYAPADHLFDGLLSFAAHGEGGIPKVELHEGWLGSTKLIPRSRFRLGQFFLAVGRLNQFHQHDWPFISAPKVHKEFFATEGALDTGGEYSYLFPTPMFLELTVGLTNGFIFGHDHSKGTRPLFPTHYARLATYIGLPSDGGSQLGLNYLGRTASEGTKRTMLGIDYTAKWKEATVTQMLLQSEIWYRQISPRDSASINTVGFYVYPQYYLGENVFLGLRFDYFSVLNLGTKNFDLNFVPTLTYRASEFTNLRLAYNLNPQYVVDKFEKTNHTIEAQAVFILGAHPAHDF